MHSYFPLEREYFKDSLLAQPVVILPPLSVLEMLLMLTRWEEPRAHRWVFFIMISFQTFSPDGHAKPKSV